MKKSITIFSLLMLSTLFLSTAHAGFEGKQDGKSLKVFNKIDCTTGMTCTRTGRGDFTMTADAPAVGSITSSMVLDETLVSADVLDRSLAEVDNASQTEGLNLGRLAIFDYDFAVDGGATGTITSGVFLPAKATIEKCWFRVETQLVDAGSGTFAMECEDTANILSAADQTSVGDGVFVDSTVDGTGAAMVDDIAATCDLSFVIAGAALTAGKLRAWCRYSVHE